MSHPVIVSLKTTDKLFSPPRTYQRFVNLSAMLHAVDDGDTLRIIFADATDLAFTGEVRTALLFQLKAHDQTLRPVV